VLDMPSFKRADAATIAAVLNAYWIGIKQVMAEPDRGAAAAEPVGSAGSDAVGRHRR
jgi:hypothetical protein